MMVCRGQGQARRTQCMQSNRYHVWRLRGSPRVSEDTSEQAMKMLWLDVAHVNKVQDCLKSQNPDDEYWRRGSLSFGSGS